MNHYKRLYWAALGAVIALCSVPPVAADDTELFFPDPTAVSSNELNADPNVLFVIDTSGSMNAKVYTQEPWDPSRTWSGNYRSDAIYWTEFSGEPSSNSDNWFYKTAQNCDTAVDPLYNLGLYEDNLAAWKEEDGGGGGWCPSWAWWNCGGNGTEYAWLELNDDYHSRPVECEADAGIHGEGINHNEVDPSKKYIADGENIGPWSATQNFTWNDHYTLYDGNYLNWKNSPGTVVGTRLEVVQDVTKTLLDSLSGINVGLMRFNYSQGGPVLHELAPIDTARDSIKASIDTMSPNGWTPLSETLYEAGQYYAGRAVDFGNADWSQRSVANSRVNDNINSTNYDSPIEFSCQKNYIVMLTDGGPTKDDDANTKIKNLPGFQAATGQTACTGQWVSPESSADRYDGVCLEEMAEYLKDHDMSDLDGDQEVITHFIGFDIDLPLLDRAAAVSGGEHKLATNTATLALSLTEIILDIFDESTSFTSPSVPVNAFNRMQNLNDVFVSVFEPSNRMHWAGNLKKYRLVNGKLTGVGNTPAVDPATGFFSTDPAAHSYWSAAADGDDVKRGGAGENLPSWQTRKVYTNLTGSQNVTLSNGSNDFSVTSSVSATALGIPDPNDSALRAEVIDWARGKDIWNEDDDGATDDDRNVMGAPLHVAPVTMIYGGTANDPDALVFTSTNDGYLHAVDARTGVEAWSFIPSPLLSRIFGLYLNEETPNVSYGLDGNLKTYIKDNDFIPGINPANEKAYLFFGMRRGGNLMFAVDVTYRNAPKLAWVIGPGSDPALADLGQTWSAPSIFKVDIGGTTKHVALIGGGYDDGQDAAGYFEDSVGNAVYMIDIDTGAVVWSAGDNAAHDLVMNTASNAEANATMKHSFPAPVRGVDMTGNGYVDRIYAADMGGRVWRFDVFNGASTAAELVGGGLLATVGAADLTAPSTADVRRFYAPPDVVPILAQSEHGKSYIAVNIGSGHRAHPLEMNNNDWFFSIRDFDFFQKRTTDEFESPAVFSDLIDITDYDPSQVPLLSTDRGWRLKLEAASGEKITSSSLTLNGTVFFTSFSPTPPTNSCSEAVHGGGTNRLYRVSVNNGNPAPHPDDVPEPPAEMDKTDRITELTQGGMAPGPVAFFTEDDPTDDPNDPDDPDDPDDENCDPNAEACDGPGDPDVCIGPVCFESGVGDGFVPTFWFQNETQ